MKPRPASRADWNQRLRVRRFLLASAFSLLYLVVLVIFHTQGKIDRVTLEATSWIVVALIAAFFALFRFRLNLRFPDPSLTRHQFVAAMATMLFVFYRAPETRLVFAAFFFVALMFGMLRASGRQLAVLGSVSLAAFALVAGARHAGTGDVETLRLDLLQFIVTAIAFPWFVLIGSRVKQLSEADRAKDDFLATLAHELRNPLAPIRTGVEILRLTSTEPRAQSVVPMMERQLRHLTRLLDDLLDVSRITRGKVTLRLERIDLASVVQAAVDANRPFIAEKGHELAVDLPPEPVPIDADPVRLAQVLSNLLDNAAKYTPPGGKIALRVERSDDGVLIRVSDNGMGIPREHLQSIFGMFTQIQDHAAHAHGGLGIGLALVKGLVGLHHGSIEAHSAGPRKGSEFRVWLPLSSTQAPGMPAAHSIGAGKAPRRVLVVDDNRDAAASLAMLLELLGHEVHVAHDGESALRLARAIVPQAMLVDLGMPGIDGYEVCRRIRAEPWGRDVRIIAATGWAQDEDRRRSADAGFDAHLVKPISPESLATFLDA